MTTCEKNPRWMWIIHNGEIVTHRLPGWNSVPPEREVRYLTKAEVDIAKWLYSECPDDSEREMRWTIEGMVKLHLRL